MTFDTETRVLIGLFEMGTPAKVSQVAKQAKVANSTARTYLHRIHNVGKWALHINGLWRLNVAGTTRAKALLGLGARQKRIWIALRKKGEASEAKVAKELGVSQYAVWNAFTRFHHLQIATPLYNAGKSGWVYTA